jgi:hypothetical protein
MMLGSVKVGGIGLGTAGVLFAGILTGYFGKPVDHATLEFVKYLAYACTSATFSSWWATKRASRRQRFFSGIRSKNSTRRTSFRCS